MNRAPAAPVPAILMLLLICPLLSLPSLQPQDRLDAQDGDPIPVVVVEPTEGPEPGHGSTGGAAPVVSEADILNRSYRTLPQALRDVPQVMVQETAHGQGSPYLRGFTGYQTLLLVDGIRLNHAAFRAGPNQYWNTVDATSLDRLVVDLGPNSARYGSDALGGVVRAWTRNPYGEVGRPTGALTYRFSDAGNYHIMRAEGSLVTERAGVLIGFTAKDFGDLEGGQDVGLQPGTGYDETAADIKVEHWIDDSSRLILGHYRVNQNDVPRTHRTIDGIDWMGLTSGSDLSRVLDQNRELTYLQYHKDDLPGFFDAMQAGVAWQTHTEERVRERSNGNVERQGFDVGSLQIFHHATRTRADGTWLAGIEYWRDDVDSFLDKGVNQTAADDIQGPVGDEAFSDSLGLFAEKRTPLSKNTDWILAGRWNTIAVDADSVRDPIDGSRTAVHERYGDLSLRLDFEHRLNTEEETVLYAGVSQGFRAPNLSDLTRFDSARTGEFEVPAFDLEEENVLGFEVGVRAEQGRARYDLGAFLADIEDGIVRVPTGNTNSEGEAEITKANLGDGAVWGWAGRLEWDLTEQVEFHLDAAYQRGEQDTFPTSAPVIAREAIDRMMPFTMHTGLRWKAPSKKQWVELRLTHASAADRLSTRDQADTSRIPVGGTPGYSLLDLRAGFPIGTQSEWTIGLENLFDEDFRVHGSGVNGPGRGLTLGLVLRF